MRATLLTLACIMLAGCTTTTAAPQVAGGMIRGVSSTAATDGDKVQITQGWADEEVRIAEIKAGTAKKVRNIELDAASDMRAMDLVSAARETASEDAAAILRQRRLQVGTDELGHSVRTITDSERLYQEEKARRESLEAQMRAAGLQIVR